MDPRYDAGARIVAQGNNPHIGPISDSVYDARPIKFKPASNITPPEYRSILESPTDKFKNRNIGNILAKPGQRLSYQLTRLNPLPECGEGPDLYITTNHIATRHASFHKRHSVQFINGRRHFRWLAIKHSKPFDTSRR